MAKSVKMSGKQAKAFWAADWAPLVGMEVGNEVWVEDASILVNGVNSGEDFDLATVLDSDLILFQDGYLQSDEQFQADSSLVKAAAKWLKLTQADFVEQTAFSILLPIEHRNKLVAFLEKHAGKLASTAPP